MHGNPNEITFFEKINEVIDLCIDHELYQYLEHGQILMLSDDAKKYLDDLQRNNGTEPLNRSFGRLPILEVKIPFELINPRLKGYTKPLRLTNNKWSNLFWIKRLRAEILKHNNHQWDERYDDLILFLETDMPTEPLVSCKRNKQNKDLCLTFLTFLMELSALDNKEASYGYAERGRRLLEKMDLDNDKRKKYLRWIWWNMAMALQHMGRNQEAVQDFNRVIKTFRDKVSSIDALIEDDNFTLEFLLNIGPARMQRASIQLRLQLGHHALWTLSDEYFVGCLEKLKDDGAKLFQEAAVHLINKKEMLEVEALLQLEKIEEAKLLIDKLGNNEKIFEALASDWNARLPEHKDDHGAIQIQFVEQVVDWYLENAKILQNRIINFNQKVNKYSNNDDDISQICHDTGMLISRLASVEKIYWDWVNGNRFNERIYFSRWAQFLGVGINIYQQLNNNIYLFDDNVKKELLDSLNRLYETHRKRLPDNDNRQETIKLKDFRSDDIPDFLTGLSEFYKRMSEILNENCNKPYKPLNGLKVDHLKLLAAVDDFEKRFGEYRRISSLKRCNERLIWLGQNIESKNGCKSCLETNDAAAFSGLIRCNIVSKKGDCNSKDKDLMDLLKYLDYQDYESIMTDAENRLVKHLQKSSIHGQNGPSLHFMGLQRWNSLTPAQGRSVGGGYLIYQTDQRGEIELGIAIDPGYDYVRNLFKMGFSLKDIDIILISHAHPDHLWDFESMVHLVHELDDKMKVTHPFNVILTLGSYHRLEHIITDPELRKYINPLVIDIDKEIEEDFLRKVRFKFCMDKNAKLNSRDPRWRCIPHAINQSANGSTIDIHCTKAYHDDRSERSDSFGFKIKFNDVYNSNNELKELWFGYTGDTKWVGNDLYNEGCPMYGQYRGNHCAKTPWENVAPQYMDCDVLLIHLGSLIDHKDKEKNRFDYYKTAKECESLIRNKNHPYLMGIIRFLKSLREAYGKSEDKLILIGEFGEELRCRIRIDLVRRLKNMVTSRIVPVDVGLDVLMTDNKKRINGKDGYYKFLCPLCDTFRPIRHIEYFPFGQDEAIFHICGTCLKAVPDDVRNNKLKELYEIGRELKSNPLHG